MRDSMNKTQCWIAQTRQICSPPPLVYDFLHEHGKTWETAGPSSFGIPQQCFKNSLCLARLNDWHYAEGFAIPKGLFPLEHAWCVRADGKIVDPTWEEATDYCGVVFQTKFASEVALLLGCYSILPNLYLLHRHVKDLEAYLKSGLVIA